MRQRGHSVFATVQEFDGCRDVLRLWGVDAKVLGSKYEIGHHDIIRTMQWHLRRLILRRSIAKDRFDIAAGYGSSTQAAVAGQLAIPLFTGTDYEYVNLRSMRRAMRVMIPEVIPETKFIEAGVAAEAMKIPGAKGTRLSVPISTG